MNKGTITFIFILLVFCVSILLFFFITNKTKYGKKVSKIVVLIIIFISFYNIYINGFKNLGILSGAIILGLTWGTIFAVRTKHFFNTIQLLFYACMTGWIFSFGIACLEFGNISFETSIRAVSLIGLVLSAISTIASQGTMFSLISLDYTAYMKGGSTPTHKKIRARTYDFGLFKETTYRDEDGNETKIDHWKY